jgi:hypothetical protein
MNSIVTVKVFAVNVSFYCQSIYHNSVKFMMHNKIYDCLMLLPPFHISAHFLITNVILSFQQTKAVRIMEQTSDDETILKSPFPDQVVYLLSK